ncbi:MAG: phage holin family protein, partial [Janthinobacterium lividum]
MHLLLVWLLSAVSLIIAAYVLPSVAIESFGTAMIAAALIGLLNAT